jgi:hypothetical protein
MWFPGRRATVTGVVGAAFVAAAACLPGHASGNERSTELLRAGYQFVYNLDHDEALAAFQRAVEADPGDPAAYRALAAITWLNLMFTRGALSADEFLSSLPESNAAMKPPPADMAATFHTNIDTAIRLAEAQVRLRPRDATA